MKKPRAKALPLAQAPSPMMKTGTARKSHRIRRRSAVLVALLTACGGGGGGTGGGIYSGPGFTLRGLAEVSVAPGREQVAFGQDQTLWFCSTQGGCARVDAERGTVSARQIGGTDIGYPRGWTQATASGAVSLELAIPAGWLNMTSEDPWPSTASVVTWQGAATGGVTQATDAQTGARVLHFRENLLGQSVICGVNPSGQITWTRSLLNSNLFSKKLPGGRLLVMGASGAAVTDGYCVLVADPQDGVLFEHHLPPSEIGGLDHPWIPSVVDGKSGFMYLRIQSYMGQTRAARVNLATGQIDVIRVLSTSSTEVEGWEGPEGCLVTSELFLSSTESGCAIGLVGWDGQVVWESVLRSGPLGDGRRNFLGEAEWEWEVNEFGESLASPRTVMDWWSTGAPWFPLVSAIDAETGVIATVTVASPDQDSELGLEAIPQDPDAFILYQYRDSAYHLLHWSPWQGVAWDLETDWSLYHHEGTVMAHLGSLHRGPAYFPSASGSIACQDWGVDLGKGHHFRPSGFVAGGNGANYVVGVRDSDTITGDLVLAALDGRKFITDGCLAPPAATPSLATPGLQELSPVVLSLSGFQASRVEVTPAPLPIDAGLTIGIETRPVTWTELSVSLEENCP